MALTVRLPVEQISLPEADALSHSFRAHGGKNELVGGFIEFPFDNVGETYFSTDAYALCNGYGWECDDGCFFHVFTEALKDNLVPVAWPGSKDAEGERISYENYFRLHADLGDDTFLFRIQRRLGGTSTGWMALSDADRLIFQADLCTGEGEQLLVKSEGLALIPPSEEG